MLDIGDPLFISALFAISIGLILYFLFVPRNVGQIAEKKDDASLMSRFVSEVTNDIHQSLPRGVTIGSKRGAIESLIQRSGNPWGVTFYEFSYLRIILALAGSLLGFLIGFGFSDILPQVPLFVWSIGFALFGFFIPKISYTSEANDRDAAFIKELPAALDLLIVSVFSGQSLQAAIRECTPLMRDGTVKDAFQKLNISLASGKGLDESLEEFAQTAPNDGIKTFVKALQEANELNTPIIETLQTRADASRQEYFAYIKQLASQLDVKMRLSMLVTMIPALLIILIAPALVSFASFM